MSLLVAVVALMMVAVEEMAIVALAVGAGAKGHVIVIRVGVLTLRVEIRHRSKFRCLMEIKLPQIVSRFGKKFLLILTGLIIIIAGLLIFLNVPDRFFGEPYAVTLLPSDNTMMHDGVVTRSELAMINKDYQEGVRLLATDETGALEAFTRARDSVETPEQRAMVEFARARTLYAVGDVAASVTTFHDLIKNESVPAVSKAYAINELASLYYSFYDSLLLQLIFASSGPFADLQTLSQERPNAAMRAVIREGIAFAPLPALVLRETHFLANELTAQVAQPTIAADEFSLKRATVVNNLATVDAGIELLKNNNDIDELVKIYNRYGQVLAALRSGDVDGFPDPEGAFTLALRYAAEVNNPVAVLRTSLEFAVYLARINNPTENQKVLLQENLSRLVEQKNEDIVQDFYLSLARQGNDTFARERLSPLLQGDHPEFLLLLRDLGWQNLPAVN